MYRTRTIGNASNPRTMMTIVPQAADGGMAMLIVRRREARTRPTMYQLDSRAQTLDCGSRECITIGRAIGCTNALYCCPPTVHGYVADPPGRIPVESARGREMTILLSRRGDEPFPRRTAPLART